MKTALIISSQVAASRVGASASAFCLQRMGINAIVLPTTLLGRHPGWGAPGGGAVDAARLADMWERIEEQDLKIDAVMTGYMATPEHITLAARIMDIASLHNDELITLVDPVMGDHGRLYVPEDIAAGLIETLIPKADYVTPNLWELGYITGQTCESAVAAYSAALSLPCAALVTSVPGKDAGIGAMLCDGDKAWSVSHPAFKTTPHGGGDALAGLFLAQILSNLTPKDALASATASIYQVLKLAADTNAPELPLIEGQDALIATSPLPLIEYS